MSAYCIHEKIWVDDFFEPIEYSCKVNDDHDCDNCPYRYSKEDYENDMIDYEYDRYIEDSFDF